jgi:hypothetical protein
MRRNGCGEIMKKEYTIEERASLLDGLDVWQTKPLSDLPSILMTDGPHGLRKQRSMVDNLGSEGSEVAVCYPTASLMACSFDPKLIEKMAPALQMKPSAKGFISSSVQGSTSNAVLCVAVILNTFPKTLFCQERSQAPIFGPCRLKTLAVASNIFVATIRKPTVSIRTALLTSGLCMRFI